jgi:hypothetical protein
MSMFETKTRVQKHTEKSKKAFDVFQSTVSDLATANQAIEEDIVVEKQIIEDAKASKLALEGIRDKNSRLVNKINEFFELV